jgi:hypothetical protein
METVMNRIASQFGKWFLGALVVAGVAFVAPIASADDDDFRIESNQGPVESVDYTANKMVVGGVSYNVAIDANVELGGSYGAFTMITPGMNVQILIRRYLTAERPEIIDVKELPPGVTPVQY